MNAFALQDMVEKIATKMKTTADEMPAHLVPNVSILLTTTIVDVLSIWPVKIVENRYKLIMIYFSMTNPNLPVLVW